MSQFLKKVQRYLNEDSSTFDYIDGSNCKPNTGNSETAVTGKIDDKEDGKPVVTDRIAKTMTVNPWFARAARGMGKQGVGGIVTEDNESADNQDIDQDKDDDGVDDFFENDDIDVLNDNNPDNNLTRLPQTVLRHLQILLNDMSSMKLNPRQCAMIISKILDVADLSKLNNIWKKDLKLKINAKRNLQQ